jgi:hypothetical protein
VLPALLVVVAIFAGWRTVTGARAILRSGEAGGPSAERQAIIQEEAKERALIERVAREDSLLSVLGSTRVPPDPFRPRYVAGPPKPPAPPPEVVVETPSVVLSAFDRDRPEIVLRVGEKMSGRLTQGQSWEGWTIVVIDRTTVELAGYDKTVRIPVPNQM